MRIFFLLFTLLLSNIAQAQLEESGAMSQILDSAIAQSKEISFYSETVDWDSLANTMHHSAKGAATIDDLKPAFEILLNSLRDHHGTIRKTSDYSIIAHFTDHQNSRKTDNREFDPEIWKIINDVESRFEYAILPDDIGYLKVVGVGPNLDGQKEADRIRNAVQELSQENITQWIIDLRYNGGGNINVMLAGLAPLLDTTTVASVENEAGNTQFTVEIRDGDFWYAGVNAFEVKNKPAIHNPKIALLLSRWTVSSGELVAIAFKGQKNTKLFGEYTGGFTTNNGWQIIDDQIVLVMSTGVYCDRNGQSYIDHVKPDQLIPFVLEPDKAKDIGIVEAIKWLEQQD